MPRELLRHIGSALISEHTLVGRVEVADKPEIIWEHPGPGTASTCGWKTNSRSASGTRPWNAN